MTLKDISKGLIFESVSAEEINDALDNHKRVIINYTNEEGTNMGARVIEVHAYGQTKAGNDVIRAFQPMGDSLRGVPNWKFFRVDRITAWKPTNQEFSHPADFYYQNVGSFNTGGDKTMSNVYKVATFDGSQTMQDQDKIQTPPSGPKTKQDEKPSQAPQPYKTDTENRMERLRQQLANPIKLSDLKAGTAFRDYTSKPQTTGPKTVQDEKPEQAVKRQGTDDIFTNDYNYNVFDKAQVAQGKDEEKASMARHYYWQNRDAGGRFAKGFRNGEISKAEQKRLEKEKQGVTPSQEKRVENGIKKLRKQNRDARGRFAKGFVDEIPQEETPLTEGIMRLREMIGDRTDPIPFKNLKEMLRRAKITKKN